ncbi:MAG: replicative DNA helicase [Lachnospiraceae bacterium]|nr:replicative DNA helicase [Lachnospiraceae bacterium]
MEEPLVTQKLPNDLDAEKSILGSILMDPEVVITASEMISGDDFYLREHGLIYDTMVKMFNNKIPIDPVTLQDKLRETNLPEDAFSPDKMNACIDLATTSAGIKHHCIIVYEKAVKRRLIKACNEITKSCYTGKGELSLLLDTTEKSIFDIVQRRNTEDFVPIDRIVMNSLAMIEKAHNTDGTVTGIPSGFTDLDYKTTGFQPSDLILLAARPSMGKTAFALNIAIHVAAHEKKHVAVFSLEMSKEQLVNRLLAQESHVDSQKLRTGNLADNEWASLIEGAETVGKSYLVIDDTPGISVPELRSKCRKQKLERGLDMIIIDYLQLMSGSGKSESRQNEVSEISRSLKAIARELGVPIIALSQLSRKVEERADHRPQLSDLRESGAIEQDADVVMFIDRERQETADVNKATIIIAKQRNGPIGDVNLLWLPQYTQFADIGSEKANNYKQAENQ